MLKKLDIHLSKLTVFITFKLIIMSKLTSSGIKLPLIGVLQFPTFIRWIGFLLIILGIIGARISKSAPGQIFYGMSSATVNLTCQNFLLIGFLILVIAKSRLQDELVTAIKYRALKIGFAIGVASIPFTKETDYLLGGHTVLQVEPLILSIMIFYFITLFILKIFR